MLVRALCIMVKTSKKENRNECGQYEAAGHGPSATQIRSHLRKGGTVRTA